VPTGRVGVGVAVHHTVTLLFPPSKEGGGERVRWESWIGPLPMNVDGILRMLTAY